MVSMFLLAVQFGQCFRENYSINALIYAFWLIIVHSFLKTRSRARTQEYVVSIPGGRRGFFLHYRFQTDFGAMPTSYLMGIYV
jgi:hypothetical protein